MFPTGASMSGLTPQQWATYAAMSGHQASTFHLGGLESNGVLLSAVPSNYVRLAPSASQSPSALHTSALHSATNPYTSALGYSLQPTIETPVPGRPIAGAALTPSYQLQPFPQTGSASQSLPFSPVSLPYGQSFPYLQPILPSLCSAHVQQCSSVPSQHQTALLPGAEPLVRVFDSLKGFGTLPSEQNRRNKPMITSKTNLYISGLNDSDTDDTVRSLVKDVVQPKSCKAMISNGVCKGYGFIDCVTEEDAERAKSHIIEYSKVTGRKLLVKFAHENEKDVLNVYVRHLPLDFTKEKLEDLFRKYGQITSVKLLENEDRLTGIGFVRYASAEQAEKAIEQMNAEKLILGSNTAPVMCKLADKANIRRRVVGGSHVSTTLMLHPSVPLAHQNQKQTVNLTNPMSLTRGTVPLPQLNSTSLAQTTALNNPLLSSLNQPHLILQTPTSSSQTRTLFSPNGSSSCNSCSPLLPMSFPAIPSGALTTHSTTFTNRTTPLIGPPPNSQLPAGTQSNQNNASTLAANYLNPLDTTYGSCKSAHSLQQSRLLNVPAGSAYFPSEGALSDPTSVNGLQPLFQLNTLPVTVQYTSPFAHPAPQTVGSAIPNAISAQLLLLAHASASSTNATSAAPFGSLLQHPHQPFQFPQLSESANKSCVLPLSVGCPQLNSATESLIYVNTNTIVDSAEQEMHSLSLNASARQQTNSSSVTPVFPDPKLQDGFGTSEFSSVQNCTDLPAPVDLEPHKQDQTPSVDLPSNTLSELPDDNNELTDRDECQPNRRSEKTSTDFVLPSSVAHQDSPHSVATGSSECSSNSPSKRMHVTGNVNGVGSAEPASSDGMWSTSLSESTYTNREHSACSEGHRRQGESRSVQLHCKPNRRVKSSRIVSCEHQQAYRTTDSDVASVTVFIHSATDPSSL